jgi:hypothetical protein
MIPLSAREEKQQKSKMKRKESFWSSVFATFRKNRNSKRYSKKSPTLDQAETNNEKLSAPVTPRKVQSVESSHPRRMSEPSKPPIIIGETIQFDNM